MVPWTVFNSGRVSMAQWHRWLRRLVCQSAGVADVEGWRNSTAAGLERRVYSLPCKVERATGLRTNLSQFLKSTKQWQALCEEAGTR